MTTTTTIHLAINGAQLVAMMCFYIVASLWFAFHRYKFVRRGDQFTMPWPKPLGY